MGGGGEEVVEIQRELDSKDPVIDTTDGGVDQHPPTTFCALKNTRSRYTRAISMNIGLLVDASPSVLGKEDWALAVAGGRVRATVRSSRCNTWGEGLEQVEELQIERDGRDSLLVTIDRIDFHHRTTSCALKHARCS